MKTTKQLLQEAKALISDPRTWLRGDTFSALNGVKRYDLDGALRQVAIGDPWAIHSAESLMRPVYNLLDACVQELDLFENCDEQVCKVTTTLQYNEHPSVNHGHIMQLLDAAIARA
jgi:hypothetical protein